MVREDRYFLPIVEPSCQLCTEPMVEEVPGIRQRPSFVKSHDLLHIELLNIAADNLALLAYCLETAMSYRTAVESFVMGPCCLTVLASPKTPCSTLLMAFVPGIIICMHGAAGRFHCSTAWLVCSLGSLFIGQQAFKPSNNEPVTCCQPFDSGLACPAGHKDKDNDIRGASAKTRIAQGDKKIGGVSTQMHFAQRADIAED